MIARDARARSGITLTEILIAILIMGVGLISLATLFPLGLIRLREATRSSRAGLAFEVAADDMDTRVLMYKPSFTQTWYWTPVTVNNATVKIPRDPFVQDALPNGSIGDGTAGGGVIASGTTQVIATSNGSINYTANNVGLYSGLPFCYDPLWRSITKVWPNTGLSDPTLDFQASYVGGVQPNEARFGSALLANLTTPYGVRFDPDTSPPSAHGLQRLTNFIPWSNVTGSLNNQYPFTTTNAYLTSIQPPNQPPNQPADVAGSVFTSIDDIVFNAFTGNSTTASPLLPDMSSGGPVADWRFTWFITGKQLDAGGNSAQFSGEIVVCDGRPFGWDQVPGQSFNAPAGETVVEAVFGYGNSNKTVVLRWPATVPDPPVRTGGWICDVTYERNPVTFLTRSRNAGTPFARCYWYQIGKRTDPQADVVLKDLNYRSMTLTITSPVRATTALQQGNVPLHVNVALVMPSVINVFPRCFETIPIYTP